MLTPTQPVANEVQERGLSPYRKSFMTPRVRLTPATKWRLYMGEGVFFFYRGILII